MDGGAWWAAVHGVTKESDTTERLHFHFSLSCIGKGNGIPLQCSCLENPRDSGVWQATVHEAEMTEHAHMPPASTPWGNNLHILYRYEPQRYFVKSPGNSPFPSNSPVPVIYLRYQGQ